MNALRWILLILGVVVVTAIYFIGRRKENETTIRREPVLERNWFKRSDPQLAESDDEGIDTERSQHGDEELLDFDDLIARGLESEVADFRPQAKQQPEPVQQRQSKPVSKVEDGNSMLLDQDLVVLNLFAASDRNFEGAQLYRAFENAGFEWNSDHLFHCCTEQGTYLAVNALKPGTFPEQIEDFRTRAVALILQLPKVKLPLPAFDEFLHLAQQLQSELDARLCDGQRSSLSKQTIAYLRDEVQQYQFKHR